MSLEIWLVGESLAGLPTLLHCLSTQLEHHKDDHLVMMMMIKMMITMTTTMMMMMMTMMMMMMLMIKTRQNATTLAKVPRNIAKITRRSRVVPT